MNTTKDTLFNGCLIASISHAIMTNIYPELSYEQSWDGENYSIQNTEGLRGTITFDKRFCVGAIRNETATFAQDDNFINKAISDFPSNIIELANRETLQYLLVESNGKPIPLVTSVFWADDSKLYYKKELLSNIDDDLNLLSKVALPEDEAIAAWKEYYGMNSDAVKLLKLLLDQKKMDSNCKIVLNTIQKGLIPGGMICNECLESFRELNIY